MFTIRRADGKDEDNILGLWKQLINYHRSIEAFSPHSPDEAAILSALGVVMG
jgi:hypothetical protein